MKTKNTRRFWMLFRQMPHIDIEAEKEAMVQSFTNGRTASITEMNIVEFQMMLASLEGRAESAKYAPRDAELDRARKRVMAAIGKYLRRHKYEENAVKIFAVALRACEGKYKKFNDIPLGKLQSIYAAFANHARIAEVVDAIDMTAERRRLAGLYQEAMDGEEYEMAAEYHKKLEMCR